MEIKWGFLFVAFFLVYFFTFALKKLAFYWGVLDLPDARKVHTKATPRLGGLGIYIGFTLVFLGAQDLTPPFWGVFWGSSIILLFGLLDDLKGISPWLKLLGQLGAALAAVSLGVRVDFITHPFDSFIFLGYFAVPLTILWIIGITNALNLIDGLDGLAAGTAAIAAFTLAIVAYLEGEAAVVFPALLLVSCILAFLRYNFYPAQIFMGDSGSLLLGFYLATFSVLGFGKGATFISLVVPIFILGLPIFDTLFAIWRRLLQRQPIFRADKQHLHHRLLEHGFSQRRAVLTFYGINLSLGLTAVLLTVYSEARLIIFVIVLAAILLLIANKFWLGKKFFKRWQAGAKEDSL